MNINKLNRLHPITKKAARAYPKSELIDTSYGKFYVKIMWKLVGPISLIFGLIFIYITITSYYYDSLDLLMGIIIAVIGAIMCYVTFTNRNSNQK